MGADRGSLRWAFTTIPQASKAKLSNPSAAAPTFLADLPGTYVIALIVNDGTMQSLPSTVVITTGTCRPLANAGPDQTASVGNAVTLDGTGSKDADNNPLAFLWDMIAKPEGSTSVLASPTATHPTFVPDLPGLYVTQLIVSDGKMESYPDTVAVSALVSMITMPNVVGLSQSAAESTITAASLSVGTITTAHSDTVSAGYVIGQSPQAGASVPERSSVSLLVSLGPLTVTVPDVVGMDQASAETTLTGAQLTVGTVILTYSDTVPKGQVISESPHGGRSVLPGSSISLEISLGPVIIPPDPVTVAPPLDPTVATTVGSSTQFLYTGDNPIQAGAAPGTIEPQRTAVLRGKVSGQDGNPVAGVLVTILDHPEFGVTLTRADGMFDMAVNGGGYLTVTYTKSGYLVAQRQVQASGQDYVWVPDVVLIPADTQVTTIEACTLSTPIQVAQGTQVADASGTEAGDPALLPQGTVAQMVLPDGQYPAPFEPQREGNGIYRGTQWPHCHACPAPFLERLHLCGGAGCRRGPAAGAKEVQFDRPVYVYVDDFIGFPVGSAVPTGYYDRQSGQWIASDNGRVIEILGISGGLAQVDTDGDGLVDDQTQLEALNITPAGSSSLHPSIPRRQSSCGESRSPTSLPST